MITEPNKIVLFIIILFYTINVNKYDWLFSTNNVYNYKDNYIKLSTLCKY